MQEQTKFGRFHDKYYKHLLIIPIVILLFSCFYLYNFNKTQGDIIHKDISLKGGTSVTISDKINIPDLKLKLSDSLEELQVREIYDLITREQKAVVIETTSQGEQVKKILEDYLGYTLDEENSSFEFSDSSFTSKFYTQLLWANIIAFILMSLVVFIIYRSFVPSFTVISCVLIDVIMTLVAIDIIGIKLSTAGIIAFLMLIGYSVDTDILLTTRLMKREGDLNEKIYGSFKTGITMTLTSLLAVIAALFIVKSFSEILTQIFLIISIGLTFDILNTWLTNVSILKWYLKEKK